jgi:hypothetical protein
MAERVTGIVSLPVVSRERVAETAIARATSVDDMDFSASLLGYHLGESRPVSSSGARREVGECSLEYG